MSSGGAVWSTGCKTPARRWGATTPVACWRYASIKALSAWTFDMRPTVALLALALLAAPAAGRHAPDGGVPDLAGPHPTCPPSLDHQHCLVVRVIPQRHRGAFASLLARLRKDGVRTSSDRPGQLAV